MGPPLTGPHSRIYNAIVWERAANFTDRAVGAACLAVWASALIIIRVDWGRKQWKEQELHLGGDQKEDFDSLNMKICNIFLNKGWKHRRGGGEKIQLKVKNKRTSLEGDQGAGHPLIDESPKHEQRNV